MKFKKLVAFFLVMTMTAGAMPSLVFADENEGIPADTKVVESSEPESTKPEKPAASKPAETKPEETKPAETKPEETKPAESEPEETKPAESKPAETKQEESQPAETKPEESKPEETTEAEPPKSVGEEDKENEEKTPESDANSKGRAGQDGNDGDKDGYKKGDVITSDPKTESTNDSTPADNDKLFNAYVEKKLNKTPTRLRKSSVGSGLTGFNKQIYDYLASQIKDVADGKNTSTEFDVPLTGLTKTTWTESELGCPIVEGGSITAAATNAALESLNLDIDAAKINKALLADFPYELYWYDKTADSAFSLSYPGFGADYDGYSWVLSLSSTSVTIKLMVAQGYSAGSYKTDSSKMERVNTAISNAASIVESAKSKSDYEKLVYYRQEICSRVAYNSAAANNTGTPFGDPWQLISVFDNDNSTEVVCEGYSKAFKYLCDQSAFKKDVSCITVTGTMTGGTGSGPHMWNIVTMDDGKNYLVDVTNCDAGSVGSPDLLFLKGYASGNANSGYTFVCNSTNVSFVYDADTKGLYSNEQLTISGTDYNPGGTVVASGSCGANLTWTLNEKGTLTISGTGAMTDWTTPDNLPWKPNRYDITEIIISKGVTTVGKLAFCSLENVKSVSIPEGVTSIGYGAFQNNAITDINIPSTVTVIDMEAFYSCGYLKSLSIPEKVESIGVRAFALCGSLETVVIPDKDITIGNGAFSDCKGLVSVLLNRNSYSESAFPGIPTSKLHFYYKVTYQSAANGTVSGKTETYGTDTVEFLIKPATGYVLDKLTWSTASGTPAELQLDTDNKCVMPDSNDDITIVAYFRLAAGYIVTGNSVFRTSASDATVRFNSSFDGTYYYVVNSSISAPSAADIKAASSGVHGNGSVYAGNCSISITGMSSGEQYCHLVLFDGTYCSDVVTFAMPKDFYFFDGFASYKDGTKVTSSDIPFSLKYNGTGDSNQAVTIAKQKDGTDGNVLQLQGASGWASTMQLSITPDGKQYLVLETGIYAVSGTFPGGISFGSSKAGGKWSKAVGCFETQDGKFRYGINDEGASIDTDATFTSGEWHELKLVLDRTNNVFYTFLDGELIFWPGFNSVAEQPEWITIGAGNAGVNTTYFDDIKLYSTDTFKINNPVTPGLKGASVYRSNASTADVKVNTTLAGKYYYVVTSGSTAPSAADIKAADSGVHGSGTAVLGVIPISITGMSSGAQYCHIVVESNGEFSSVLTIPMMYDFCYFDDFDAYDNNTAVTSGITPFVIKYNGTGNANQKVITAKQQNGSSGKVMQLQGSSSWAADIRAAITPDSKRYIVFEVDIKSESGSDPGGLVFGSSKVSGSWTNQICSMSLYDGKIYLNLAEGVDPIIADTTYSNGTWNKLTLVLDRTNNKAYYLFNDVWIPGGELDVEDAAPEWISLGAGNRGGTNTSIFDNVRLYSTDTYKIVKPSELSGNSVYRTNAATAKVKFNSTEAGTYYYVVNTDSTAPSAESIKAASSGVHGSGTAAAGTNSIDLSEMSSGKQYIHVMVVSEGFNSKVLTIPMPYDLYYFEDFESYPSGAYISSGALSPISQAHNGTGNSDQKVTKSITSGKMLSLSSSSGWASDQIVDLSGLLPSTGRYVFEGDVAATRSSTETSDWLLRFSFTNKSYTNEAGILFQNRGFVDADSESVMIKEGFTKDTWYHIKIEVFPEIGKYCVYINGEKSRIFDLPSGAVCLGITAGHGYTAYYDNLDFYADPDYAPEIKTWADLQTALNLGGTVKLTQDITAGTGDGPLVVTGTVKLDLNGYVIDRNLKTATSNGGVIFVDENGNLTINDSRPEATHSPAVKYKDLITGNDVVVKGGIITGGYSKGYAGGIRFKWSAGTMNGGTIVGNKATNDNDFENAGGVLLYCSDFTINGGTICGNEAVFNGGKTNNIAAGVSITNLQGRPCNLNVNSGTITSNYTNTTEACCIGGIYNHASSISVSGKTYIYGNMKNGKDNNVCAENNYDDSYDARAVRLSGKLTDGARIGVTTWRIPPYWYSPEGFTSGFSTYNQGEHPSKYFSLDEEKAIMVFDDSGEAKVALKFTITLSDDGNGSASVTPTDIYYDLHPTLVATPNQGYVFKEWQVLSGKATISNDNRIYVGAEDPNKPVTDIKIKAVFEKQKFNVTFVDGTATLGTVAVVAGEKVTKPTDPVKDGYRFDGWYEEPSFDHQFDFDTAINKETTVYANFIQEFSITVTSGSADMAKAIAGEVVTITAGAAPSGYVFDKWVWVTVPGTVAIADPAATVTSFNMPAGNVEIKATFKVKSGTCGDGSSNLTWEIDYTTGTLTISGTGKMADWGDVDSVPWYPARDSIKSLVIADGVTSIGDRAFNGYSNLEDVTISDTVTSIGHWAFSKCIGIENIELPENLSTIYSGAFNGCTGIKSISIPDKAASVSDNAFKDCTNLESVSINRDVFRPEEFSGCTSAVFHFYYDVKYTAVGNGTVDGKTRTFGTDIIALQVTAQDGYVVDKITWTSADQTVVLSPDGNGNFVMPDSDNPAEITVLFKPAGTEVVNEFIYQITNPAIDGTGTVTLKGIVTPAAAVSVPATVDINGITYKVNRIGTKAFYNDKTIKTLYIGSNVVTIDSYAFYGCSNMTKVSGGYRLQTLGTSAFAYCSKLSSFTITSSVLKKIGNYAFNKDKKLKTIYIRKTTKLSKSGVKKSLKGSSVKTVKVKKSKVKKYKKYFKKSNSGRKVKVKK